MVRVEDAQATTILGIDVEGIDAEVISREVDDLRGALASSAAAEGLPECPAPQQSALGKFDLVYFTVVGRDEYRRLDHNRPPQTRAAQAVAPDFVTLGIESGERFRIRQQHQDALGTRSGSRYANRQCRCVDANADEPEDLTRLARMSVENATDKTEDHRVAGRPTQRSVFGARNAWCEDEVLGYGVSSADRFLRLGAIGRDILHAGQVSLIQ